jgi:hypothetical protein
MGPPMTTSRFPQISFTPFTQCYVFLDTCLYLNVLDFDHNEYVCGCSLSISSDSTCAVVCKVTVLILKDTSPPVTDTALNLGSKTIPIMPSFTFCYKEIWSMTDACTEHANKTLIMPCLLFLHDSSMTAFPWGAICKQITISHFLCILLCSLKHNQSICKLHSFILKQSTDDPSAGMDSTLKMAVVGSSQILVTSYQTIRSQIPQKCNLHRHHKEKFISHRYLKTLKVSDWKGSVWRSRTFEISNAYLDRCSRYACHFG